MERVPVKLVTLSHEIQKSKRYAIFLIICDFLIQKSSNWRMYFSVISIDVSKITMIQATKLYFNPDRFSY